MDKQVYREEAGSFIARDGETVVTRADGTLGFRGKDGRTRWPDDATARADADDGPSARDRMIARDRAKYTPARGKSAADPTAASPTPATVFPKASPGEGSDRPTDTPEQASNASNQAPGSFERAQASNAAFLAELDAVGGSASDAYKKMVERGKSAYGRGLRGKP